ncbi:MAG: hypothetical protein PHN59_06775 [Candidatus Omnitrophica bacterium]|nr:hypothetical protein [Candidatus Omnitrophota bacterium]
MQKKGAAKKEKWGKPKIAILYREKSNGKVLWACKERSIADSPGGTHIGCANWLDGFCWNCSSQQDS